VASKGEEAPAELQDDVDRLSTTLKENISVGRVVRIEAGDQLDRRHLPAPAGRPRGQRGGHRARGGTPELAHDLRSIRLRPPSYLHRDDVPADEVAAERETIEAISKNEGKPEAHCQDRRGSLERLVQGAGAARSELRPYEKVTVAKLLGGATVVRFAQVVIGS